MALGIDICIYCQSLTLFDKQLKYSVTGTEEHVFEFLSPQHVSTLIACSTINLQFPIANASLVVIHITTSPMIPRKRPER